MYIGSLIQKQKRDEVEVLLFMSREILGLIKNKNGFYIEHKIAFTLYSYVQHLRFGKSEQHNFKNSLIDNKV